MVAYAFFFPVNEECNATGRRGTPISRYYRVHRARKTNKHKYFGRDDVGTNRNSPWDEPGQVPGTNRHPSLGQTGLFLLNSTVKSPFCRVCPWDGWGFIPGAIVLQGPSLTQKNVYVFCVHWFFRQEKRAQRLTFWVRRPPGGVGVFHEKGWWSKTSCSPSKLRLPWVSKRGIWDVPEILPGCPGPLGVFKKFVQKKFVLIFRSLYLLRPQVQSRLGH